LIKISSIFWRKKRVLVTGHTGFKGAWLVIWLFLMGAKVYGISLRPRKLSLFKIAHVDKFVSNFYFDICNKSRLTSTILKINPEIIFHLAAQAIVKDSFVNTIKTFKTNIIGTANILESLKKFSKLKRLKAIIVVTSDKCYANQKDLRYTEKDKLGGDDPYSASKASAEIIVNAYKKSFFLNKSFLIATVRAGNVIGGGDWSNNRLVPDIVRSLKSKNRLLISNPNLVRPWQHVLEPLSGYLLLAKELYKNKKKFSGSWNFGPSINEKIKVINFIKIFQSKQITKINYFIKKEKDYNETKSLSLNINKARKELKWRPILNIYSAIDLTSSWYNSWFSGDDILKKTISQIIKYKKLRNNL
jgi:CDP-glucose 4,6-dehydratase